MKLSERNYVLLSRYITFFGLREEQRNLKRFKFEL